MATLNDCGVYIDCEKIELPKHNIAFANISIAQDETDKLFRYGVNYFGKIEGFGFGASIHSQTYINREDAVQGAIDYFIKHAKEYGEYLQEVLTAYEK